MSGNAIPLAVGFTSWAAAWLAWTVGSVRVAGAAWPQDTVGIGVLIGAGIATAALLTLDSMGRRGPWRPLAFAVTLAPLVVLDPTMATTTGRFAILAGAALLTFGYFLLTIRLRIRTMSASGVAADAAEIIRFAYPRYAAVLAVAAVGSFLFLSVPQWAADAVSARWAVSLDATSVPIVGAVALATTFVAGAVTFFRFAWTPVPEKAARQRSSGGEAADATSAGESGPQAV